MTRQDDLYGLGAGGFISHGNRSRCSIPRTAARAVAQALLSRCSLELDLMLACDRRATSGVFEIVWLWGDPRRNEFLEVSAEVPEGEIGRASCRERV